mmetsp:Transcript_6852/g.12064  ORF Transcript_6852/g.12064 Transcript_6852/m.12064 type:complete len:584 (-) Transcript_6852:27-1778(-)
MHLVPTAAIRHNRGLGSERADPAPSASALRCQPAASGAFAASDQAQRGTTTSIGPLAGSIALGALLRSITLEQHQRQQQGKRRKRSSTVVRAHAASEVEVVPWVAPVLRADGAPGDGLLALGAYERVEDGREWLHCQIREGEESEAWQPALLLREGDTSWRGKALSVSFTIEDLMAAVLPSRARSRFDSKAPAWPRDLVKELAGGVLKGPGAVVFDPNFFVQRGPALALRPGAGPVIFPRGAELLELSTAALSQSMQRVLGGSCLEDFLTKGHNNASLGDAIANLPESVTKGHISFTAGSRSEAAPGEEFEVLIERQPTGLRCESRSWVSGAVVRSVFKSCKAAEAGCKPGDIIKTINGMDVLEMDFDKIQAMLDGKTPLHLVMQRGSMSSDVYLREVPAEDEAMALFAGEGATSRCLVPELASHLGTRELFFGEQKPMLFAGGAGSASHIHVDKLPLIQFCHVLHGTKFFCVDADRGNHTPGPARPWSDEKTSPEAAIPCGGAALEEEASQWLKQKDVSVAAVEAGDILLFKGRVAHCGVNALGEPCVALFHGAQPTADMARGLFGPDFQFLAQRMRERGAM